MKTSVNLQPYNSFGFNTVAKYFAEINDIQELEVLIRSDVFKHEKNLILINDDVNTFEHVIKSLMEVCGHTHEQAETCAWITHYKGKCAIKHGSFDELKPYYDAMLNRQLYVSIQ